MRKAVKEFHKIVEERRCKEMSERRGILKKYPDGWIFPVGRYNQFETRAVLLSELLKKELVGYVKDGIYWMIYWEDDQYYRAPFAKNYWWFKALTSEPEFQALGELPQIYLI